MQIKLITAQTEYIGAINPSTGIYTCIDSLSGVHYIYGEESTMDKNSHHFIFCGRDVNNNNRLYCIDAITGAILSQPIVSQQGLVAVHYDNLSNTLYGLHQDNLSHKLFLDSININNAASYILDTLPFDNYSLGNSYFDEYHQTFVIQNANKFYSINVTTKIMKTINYPITFGELQVDNATGIVYGLVMSSPMRLAKIILNDSTYSTVCTFTNSSGYNTCKTTFSELSHKYIFSSTNILYSVDVNTGNIASISPFPIGMSSPQNIVELHYDNLNNTLYALHWGRDSSFNTNINSIDLASNGAILYQNYPNPFDEGTSIKYFVPESATNTQIVFYDEFGSELKRFTVDKTGQGVLNVNSNNLASGTYSYSLIINGRIADSKKMIKQ